MKLFKTIIQKNKSLKACLSGRQGFNHIVMALIPILMVAVLFSGCQSKQADKQQQSGVYYTCSMHSQIHKYKPGNCPICGMKLIKISPSGKTDKMPLDSALSYLTEPVTRTVVGSFKVTEPVKTDPTDTLIADGTIGFDQRDLNTVNTRITGRIEKLYVRYTNQLIRKGQPLMEIYSPLLLSAQRNLLQAIKDKDQTLIKALKEQLENLGMRLSEVRKVIQNKQPLANIIIYSPYSGISQHVSASQQEGMSTGMSSVSFTSSGNGTELLNIREGMYVNKGQTVFNIQNTNRIWAILNVFTNDIWHIHTGNAVNLYTDADRKHKIKGHVDFIPPYRPQDEKTTRVRIYLDHLPANWKIGMLIHGQIAINSQKNSLYVPLSAVNRLGMQSILWVQDKQHPNVFHAKQVKTGIQTGNSMEIISGINPGDKIAENAAYMVGSDSFIQ